MGEMSDEAFLDDLTQRLKDYGTDVERTAVPALKSGLSNLKSNYEALLNILKRKGLVADDPYQYSEKISEIKPVPADPFLEHQRATVTSIRTHHFDNQLSFLANTYGLSLAALSLPQIRLLTQLLRYVRWESLTETHQESNTKMMAELVARARKGDDSITTGLVNDLVNQMAQNTAKVLDALKKVTFYKREEYKHLLRTAFWSSLNFAPEEVQGNSENVQRKIRKEFAAHLKGHPFIQELVKELLDEDYSPQSATLREELLNKLKVSKATQEKTKADVDPRIDLMEGVRTLATSNLPLDSALRKLVENASLFDTSHDSLGERFHKWILKLMGIKNKPRMMAIDLFDPASGLTKSETIDFDAFVNEASGRVRLLAGVANRNGPQFIALSQKTEDEILAWFERNFIDVAKTVERVNGLDVYFKSEVPKERRAQVKGTKAEVAQIRTAMGNANKQRHEAVARREELEQLRRLGIR